MTTGSLALLFARMLAVHSLNYWFMAWNLLLAWIPLVLMLGLRRFLHAHKRRWSSWPGIGLSLLWLGFLPNSFYMVTDYIHLADTAGGDLVYDAAMLTAFVVSGLILGFLSLCLFHRELSHRLPAATAWRTVLGVLLLSSFAIYLGRDLRWNTWDLLLDPAGILFDVSDRLLSPQNHPEMLVTVVSFFVLLSTSYAFVWCLDGMLPDKARR